jgi:dTDP-4-dehydrorhamnose 3,5-epimerase
VTIGIEEQPPADDGRPGFRDRQTVTAAGDSTLPTIDGVVTHRPVVHLDHRGSLFEVYNGDPALWSSPVVYAYQCSVLPGQIKGWSRHEIKTDRYCLAVGEIMLLLHDSRPDSPTHARTQLVMLSPQGVRQVVIPAGVWHLLANAGSQEAHLVNFPTERYHHDAPDRILLPWDTDELPVDVREYLPKF